MENLIGEWLGECTYPKSTILQKNMVEQVRSGGPAHVLGMEHCATITLGNRANEKLDLKFSRKDLQEREIFVCQTDRGGEATLHSPGQVIIYPIINLKAYALGVKDYMNLLIKTTHKVLNNYGIVNCFSTVEPGLYTQKGKIAFFGIRVDRGVSYHGISININNDLELFSTIRSCGKELESFDRVVDHVKEASCLKFFNDWLDIFKQQPPFLHSKHEEANL